MSLPRPVLATALILFHLLPVTFGYRPPTFAALISPLAHILFSTVVFGGKKDPDVGHAQKTNMNFRFVRRTSPPTTLSSQWERR